MTNEPWLDEPNYKDFITHGLRCVMQRGPMRHWCGYVAVPDGHPLFGKGYSERVRNPPSELLEREIDIDKIGAINVLAAGRHEEPLEEACELVLLIDVHGGLTYSGNCVPDAKPDGQWWFGFDCAHAGDLVPDMVYRRGTYRNEKYVEAECRSLARQLSGWKEA